MKDNYGKYILVVDGSVPTGDGGAYWAAGGAARPIPYRGGEGGSGHRLRRHVRTFGGIPFADPNPTSAWPVSAIIGQADHQRLGLPADPRGDDRDADPVRFVPARFRISMTSPSAAFFGNTIHDRCYRRPFYDQGKFAKSFDDEGARNGWCLYELGCKGPTTYNAWATVKWNGGMSFPIQSGHPCLGCSEPSFWDKGSFLRAGDPHVG